MFRVVTWEPVPHFRAFLEYNRQLNHLESLIDIRDGAVAEESGKVYSLTVPARGIWGNAGIGGLNIDRWAFLTACICNNTCRSCKEIVGIGLNMWGCLSVCESQSEATY